MKKLLLVLLALCLSLSVAGTVAFAEPETESSPVGAELLDTENFLSRLCELNGQLNSASSQSVKNEIKENLINFLKEQFNLAVGEDVAEEKYFASDTISGYNIQTKIDSPSEQCVIIGAHYDAVGEGANDNACGVAVMFETMKYLAAQSSLPFDVYFVAFDCEEQGLIGSQHYVNELTDYSDVLAMFNLDSIAAGKNLYVMCENKRTDLADLILSKSETLVEKPYAAGVYNGYDTFGYGYDEFVQGSDHTPFRLAGIPVAVFFSGEYSLLGYEENAEMNTSADTQENLARINPDYLARISDLSDVIGATLTDENFVAVAQATRGQMINNNAVYNRWWPVIVLLGTLIILAVCAWLYSRKLQKKALLGHAEVKSQKVFDKPNAEDIFSFDGKPSSENKDSSDADDIFTFKN